MQLTPVVVACVSAVTTVVPELIACVVSPLYEAVIVWMATAFGVKLTAQLVETAPVVGLVLALPSVQLEAEKVPPLDRKSTRLNSRHPATSYAAFSLTEKLVA